MSVTLIALDPAHRYDVLDAFGRVFWKDMDAETTVAAVNRLGAGIYRAVETTGLDYGAKVPAGV